MLVAACGSGGGDDDDGGPAFDASGTYTVTYERISSSDTCDTRDLDFVSGVLVVSHSGGSVDLDFGSGSVASGSINVDGDYHVTGDFDVSGEAVAFTSDGTFTETDVTSDPDVDPAHETVGDFEFDSDPEPDCRVRGKYSGAKSGG